MVQYSKLRTAHDEAVSKLDQSDTVDNWQREDSTYQELIDFVEANGLNYTDYDPR